jgi:hypothetical protein
LQDNSGGAVGETEHSSTALTQRRRDIGEGMELGANVERIG